MELSILKPRHSLAHILAQAIQQSIDPYVALGTWPAVEQWFYYDVLLSDGITISEDQLKELTKIMQWLVKQWQTLSLYTAKDKAEALHIISLLDNNNNTRFKKELIEKFAAAGETSYTFYFNTIPSAAADKLLWWAKPGYKETYQKLTDYIHGKDLLANDFIVFADLCEWPHVESTKEIDSQSFVLDKVAGAYRQAKEENPQMTRIYGLAFATKDELKAYNEMMEEAKKRDHRIIGARMKLFTISPLVGSGLPLMQPNGMVIRKEIEDYLWELHKDKWYDRVRTPHLAKEDLYKTSGHAEKFGDELFRVTGWEEHFFMKPMNCPHHMQIYADNQFSYRDMPVRYFEPATVYRDEKTGQLSGLTRVRAITQDDGHLFCRVSQITEEVWTIVSIIKSFYTTMGMMNGYRVRLSIRWPEWKYLGSDEVREKAEWALRDAADKYELPYKVGVWEAAFYGPKLDFMFKDAIGREWQLATIQCDFNLPERFDLSFINEQWDKERPVVIHRAISGSLERFMGVMIEHYAWAFPLWLAPTQIMVVPVADKFLDRCEEIKKLGSAQWLRVKIDTSSDSFSKKIRNAEIDKTPYIVIIGEKEVTDDTVSVRVYKSKEQLTMDAEQFIADKVLEDHERR